MRRISLFVVATLSSGVACAATLAQTVHFTGLKASELAGLYLTGKGQERITGLPARYLNAKGDEVERGGVGDRLQAFCFEPDKCGLDAHILDIKEGKGETTIVMSWWNFGWVSASDASDYTAQNRGAPDSVLVLTFRDTPGGSQVELVQANVPDYDVVIPSPDGSKETGPLSRIVNTHWNTLYWDGVRRLAGKR